MAPQGGHTTWVLVRGKAPIYNIPGELGQTVAIIRGVECPYCSAKLERKDVEMYGSFACPQCGELLRLRRNFTLRIVRLVSLLILLVAVASFITSRVHFRMKLAVSAGVVGVLDEGLLRLLPRKVESAAPGGFVAR